MLSVMARSLGQYYLYTADNKVQPSSFIGNKVAGILFENKCDHTTYFGDKIEYIQGIHMLPLLPSTKFTRPASFVKQEWETWFDKGRAAKIEGGWKGILYANLATIDTQAAWDFFTEKDFDPSWLDGGASLAWYLAYCAGKWEPDHADQAMRIFHYTSPFFSGLTMQKRLCNLDEKTFVTIHGYLTKMTKRNDFIAWRPSGLFGAT